MSKDVLKVGLIGFGEIAKIVLAGAESAGASISCALVRSRHSEVEAEGVTAVSVDELLEHNLDVVVEAAGQAAVRQYAIAVVSAGLDLVVISAGAFTDDHFRSEALRAATGTRIVIPSGAIAGIDGLLAHREAGLTRVSYVSTKPPKSWSGTPAEEALELDTIENATEIFTGTARDAARLYPANANIAATIAIAGIGFERTEVTLIADPSCTENHARLTAIGRAGSIVVDTAGPSTAANPRSSLVTGYSILAAIRQRLQFTLTLGEPFE